MIRVLVLGSAGMAGHVMTLHLMKNPQLDVSNLSNGRCLNNKTVIMDVTNFTAFGNYLDNGNYNIVINCIGILNQFAEENRDKAVLVNSYLPLWLERKYRGTAVKVIHLSTDCVFSGKMGGYIETAFRDGDSFYARTKAAGEIVNDKDLTFRTSIIGPDLNPDGIGLFNWFMKSAGDIKGYAGVFWTGVTTTELAKAVEAAVFAGLTGLYHLVPETEISKYDLLELISQKFGRNDIFIRKNLGYTSNKSLVNTRRDFCYKIPSYGEMLDAVKSWIEGHKELYPHYLRTGDTPPKP